LSRRAGTHSCCTGQSYSEISAKTLCTANEVKGEVEIVGGIQNMVKAKKHYSQQVTGSEWFALFFSASKETAYEYAIKSAGILHAIVTACGKGNLR